MNELSKIYDVLSQLTSEEGYKVDKYLIKADAPIESVIAITKEGVFDLDFIGNLPVVHVKKIFTIKVKVLGITLKESKGVIKLDGFPDVSFDYEK